MGGSLVVIGSGGHCCPDGRATHCRSLRLSPVSAWLFFQMLRAAVSYDAGIDRARSLARGCRPGVNLSAVRDCGYSGPAPCVGASPGARDVPPAPKQNKKKALHTPKERRRSRSRRTRRRRPAVPQAPIRGQRTARSAPFSSRCERNVPSAIICACCALPAALPCPPSMFPVQHRLAEVDQLRCHPGVARMHAVVTRRGREQHLGQLRRGSCSGRLYFEM